jgi:hypothetical protein
MAIYQVAVDPAKGKMGMSAAGTQYAPAEARLLLLPHWVDLSAGVARRRARCIASDNNSS